MDSGKDGVEAQVAQVPFRERILLGIFSVAADINREPGVHPLWAVLLMIFDAVQMLSFPLNPDSSMPFAQQQLMKSIWQALTPVFFQPGVNNTASTSYDATSIFIIAFVWTLANALLLAFATYLALQEDDPVNDFKAYRPRWPAQILRVGCRLSLMGLYVPLLMSLLEPLSCVSGTSWSNTSLPCFSDLHAFLLVLAIVGLPLAFLLALGAAALLIDRRQDAKRNLLSQSHGRIGVLIVIVKTVLCLIFAFGLTPAVSTLFPLLSALAVGLIWLVSYARYLPYHQQWLNELQCGLAGVFLSATVAALLSLGINNPSSSTGTWTFLFTAPLAAFVGWALALVSRNSYAGRRELSSPYAVEVKARAMMAELLIEEASAGGTSGLGMLGNKSSVAAGSGGGKSGSSGSSSVVLNDIHARKRDIQLLYDDAANVFSGSALLELFAASYLGSIMRNRHLENVHLRAAEAKSDSTALDIRFFVWERRAGILETEAASNTVRTSVIRRLQFDTLQAESEKLCMKARANILDFWTECCEKRPDMNRLQMSGAEIIATIRRCENVYKQMMELSPGSAAVMRAYADFLLEIANNPKQALELLQLAETIEEEESRARTTDDTADYPMMSLQTDFDLSHESVSLLRVDGSAGKVGGIIDVNNAALKLFGYTRRELVGKNISSVVPEPLSTVHDRFLLRYVETGEERIVNSSRIYYGLHKGGFLFPMCANIRPMENGFGAVFEGITTSQAYILFMGEGMRWKVTGACKSTMSILNLSVEDIKAGAVTMDRLLPSLFDGMPTKRDRAKGDDEYMLHDSGEDMDDDAAAGGSAGASHSPLMNDLINSSGAVGFGVDVAFQVIDWKNALAVQAKAHRRVSMAAAHVGAMSASASLFKGMGSNPPLSSRSAAHTPFSARDGWKAQDIPGIDMSELARAFRPVRTVLAMAKLQEMPLAFLPTHIYALRWRMSKSEVDQGIDDDDEGARDDASMAGESDNASDAVQGSDAPGESEALGGRSEENSTGVKSAIKNGAPFPGNNTTGKNLSPRSAMKPLSSQAGRHVSIPAPDGIPLLSLPGNSGKKQHPPRVATPGKAEHRSGAAAQLAVHSAADLNLPGSVEDSSNMPGDGPSLVSDALAHATATSPMDDSRKLLESKPSKGRITWHNNEEMGRASREDERGATGIDESARDSAQLSARRSSLLLQEQAQAGAGGGTGKGGYARSAASGSSSGSSHITDALRKGISLRSRDMEASLIALKRALILVFLVVGAVNVISTGVTSQLFNQLIKATDFVELNGKRGIALQRAYAQVEYIKLLNDGLTSHTDALARAGLYADLEALDTYHRNLYVQSAASTAAGSSMWKTNNIVVEDLTTGVAGQGLWYAPSNYTYTNRSINLGDVGLEFIIKGRQLHKSANAAFSMTNPLVFWTLTNGPDSIRSSFNESMLVAQELTEGQAATVYLVNIVVLCVALGLQFLMITLVMVPAVRKVIKQRHSVFNVFLATPLTILRTLRARTEARINNIRRAAEEAEAGMDIAGAGEAEFVTEDDALANLPAGRTKTDDGENSSASGGRLAPVDQQLADAAQSISSKLSSSSSLKVAAAKKHKKRHERRFRSTTNLVDGRVIRLLLPMLALVAYYYGTYTWKQSMVVDSQYYKSEVFYANQISFMVAQSNYNIRNMVAECEPAFVKAQSVKFELIVDTMQRVQDGLMYGDESRQLRPLLRHSPEYFHLMMQNGCVDGMTTSYALEYTHAECSSTFFDGLVGRGLAAALKEYIQLANTIRLDRLAAVANPSTCTPGRVDVASVALAGDLSEKYLSAGLDVAATISIDLVHNALRQFLTMDIAITCASIVGLLLFFFGIYSPMIRRMDQEIKNVRHLLLLYPDEISRVVPSIIAAGREMLKDGHVSGNSSAISGQ